MASPIQYLVFRGEMSETLARAVSPNGEIPVFSETEAFGCDKATGLFIFDEVAAGRRGTMRNQGIKNNADYPYSIAVYRIKRLRDLVNQIRSDYFVNFDRNLQLWGYPWGEVNCSLRIYDPARFTILRRFGITETPYSFITWLRQAKDVESHIFLMACPDYPYDRKNGRYTNESYLNSGIGLVASKSIEFLCAFAGFAKKEQIRARAIIGLADYEDSPENLLRLNETKESFAKKVQSSISTIRSATSQIGFSVEVAGIRTLFPRWDAEWRQSYEAVANHLLALPTHVRAQKLKARSKLYSTWLPEISEAQVFEKVVQQGAEYATCGALLSSRYTNLLVVGTNSIDMAAFYQVRSPNLPVIYTARVFE